MSDHEYVHGQIEAVVCGYKSVWNATNLIIAYYARQEQTVRDDAFEEGKGSVDACDIETCAYYCEKLDCGDRC